MIIAFNTDDGEFSVDHKLIVEIYSFHIPDANNVLHEAGCYIKLANGKRVQILHLMQDVRNMLEHLDKVQKISTVDALKKLLAPGGLIPIAPTGYALKLIEIFGEETSLKEIAQNIGISVFAILIRIRGA
jgi:hypothetical protein